MLTNLFIKNIAVIDKLNVDIEAGMSVLTGETGAGKSIIIDSINLILGGRTNKSLVRYGEQKATVQAVFDVSDEICKFLSDEGIDIEENQVIISREITSDGKSVCKINSVAVPITVLKELSNNFINIHGQQDNQSLLNPSKHIVFIDLYAQNSEVKKQYLELYNNVLEIKNKIKELAIDEKDRIHKIDLLEYQIEEIEKSKLIDGEEQELIEQRNIISNAEKISRGLEIAYINLYESNNIQPAYDGISIALKELEQISVFDDAIKNVCSKITDAMYTIEDSVHEIREYIENVEYDEKVLNEIEQRLDLISKLKRKYGNSISDIIIFLETAKKDLENIQDSDEQLCILQKQLTKKTEQLSNLGIELNKTRVNASLKLQKLIEKSLSELDMPHSKFLVDIKLGDTFYQNGMDTVEFLISTNLGEPLKPLVKIASGGELSRVMLAIKSILADSDSVDTLIFDEIDTGVSGSAAQKIAIKLMQISKNKQVICITHLPQIAAMADHQFLIQKNEDINRVSTTLTEVFNENREKEIARIIDGNNITNTALKHAKEMLQKASEFKER